MSLRGWDPALGFGEIETDVSPAMSWINRFLLGVDLALGILIATVWLGILLETALAACHCLPPWLGGS